MKHLPALLPAGLLIAFLLVLTGCDEPLPSGVLDESPPPDRVTLNLDEVGGIVEAANGGANVLIEMGDREFVGVSSSFTASFREWAGGDRLEGEVVFVGRGCPDDPYLDDPDGKIALVERGACLFSWKLQRLKEAGAAGAVVFNDDEGGDYRVTMAPEYLGLTVDLPAVFVGRSTGLALSEWSDEIELEDASLPLLYELVNSCRTLSRSKNKSLKNKLEKAGKEIDEEKFDKAFSQMQKFQSEVRKLLNEERLPFLEASVLYESAQGIVADLQRVTRDSEGDADVTPAGTYVQVRAGQQSIQ